MGGGGGGKGCILELQGTHEVICRSQRAVGGGRNETRTDPRLPEGCPLSHWGRQLTTDPTWAALGFLTSALQVHATIHCPPQG